MTLVNIFTIINPALCSVYYKNVDLNVFVVVVGVWKMKAKEDIRTVLIDNAIHLIAMGGFEKATTKNLAHYSESMSNFKMNEVYIYRLFGSKEELYQSAFLTLDEEFMQAFRNALTSNPSDFVLNTKKEFYQFFLKVWQFLLNNEERCRCYVRYYYSVYFKNKALENHQQNFNFFVEKFSSLFIEEANVTAIMHSVFTTLLDFAVRVYNGELIDNEENRPHIFNVLYCMLVTYLKHPDVSGIEKLQIRLL